MHLYNRAFYSLRPFRPLPSNTLWSVTPEWWAASPDFVNLFMHLGVQHKPWAVQHEEPRQGTNHSQTDVVFIAYLVVSLRTRILPPPTTLNSLHGLTKLTKSIFILSCCSLTCLICFLHFVPLLIIITKVLCKIFILYTIGKWCRTLEVILFFLKDKFFSLICI